MANHWDAMFFFCSHPFRSWWFRAFTMHWQVPYFGQVLWTATSSQLGPIPHLVPTRLGFSQRPSGRCLQGCVPVSLRLHEDKQPNMTWGNPSPLFLLLHSPNSPAPPPPQLYPHPHPVISAHKPSRICARNTFCTSSRGFFHYWIIPYQVPMTFML